MVLEFLQNISLIDALLIIVLFLLFFVIVRKLMGVIKNVILIAIAAALFPIVTNKFLGLAIPINLTSIIAFIIIGVGAYFAYIFFKSIYSVGKLVSRILPGGKKLEKRVGKLEKMEKKKVEKAEEAPQKFLQKKQKPKTEKELFKDYAIIEEEKEKTKRKKSNG